MDRPVRIGLAGIEDSRLQAELEALPRQLQVRSFSSVFQAIDGLLALDPDLLFVGLEDGANLDELTGALVLTKRLCPLVAFVLVAPSAREVELAALRQRIGADLLRLPHSRAEVARVVDAALFSGDRPRSEVFLDLLHGVADEINNPLQFLLGYLQLLQLQLEGPDHRDAMDQIAAAIDGAHRIKATVERLAGIEHAAAGPRRADPFDVRTALEASLKRRTSGRATPTVVREPARGSFLVPGDPEILRPAFDGLAAAALEFEEAGATVHCVVTRIDAAVRLRLSLRGDAFGDWQLPRTWEPYYLCRVLRGSAHGLSFFLLQTAVHAHRGQVTARRLPDAAIAIDIELPRH